MDSPARGDDARFFDALKQLSRSLLEGLGQRLDLLSLELDEEKRRVFGVIFLAIVSAFSAFIALLCLNLAILLLSWDSHRRATTAARGVVPRSWLSRSTPSRAT